MPLNKEPKTTLHFFLCLFFSFFYSSSSNNFFSSLYPLYFLFLQLLFVILLFSLFYSLPSYISHVLLPLLLIYFPSPSLFPLPPSPPPPLLLLLLLLLLFLLLSQTHNFLLPIHSFTFYFRSFAS